MLKLLQEHQPKLIVSLHAWKPMLNTNGNCLNVFRIGDTITLVGGTVRTILSVDTANQITLTANGSHNLSNVAYDMIRTLTLHATVKAALVTAYGSTWADAYTAKGWTIA